MAFAKKCLIVKAVILLFVTLSAGKHIKRATIDEDYLDQEVQDTAAEIAKRSAGDSVEDDDDCTEGPITQVSCDLNGVHVSVLDEFQSGKMIVGNSNEKDCSKEFSIDKNTTLYVPYDKCDMEKKQKNGVSEFHAAVNIIEYSDVMQLGSTTVEINCPLPNMKGNATGDFEVKISPRVGEANTTAPRQPSNKGVEVVPIHKPQDKPTIGDPLSARIIVEPEEYQGYPKNCYVTDKNNDKKNKKLVVDDDGCATDPRIFGNFEWDDKIHGLTAPLNAFKLNGDDNSITVKCEMQYCLATDKKCLERDCPQNDPPKSPCRSSKKKKGH